MVHVHADFFGDMSRRLCWRQVFHLHNARVHMFFSAPDLLNLQHDIWQCPHKQQKAILKALQEVEWKVQALHTGTGTPGDLAVGLATKSPSASIVAQEANVRKALIS